MGLVGKIEMGGMEGQRRKDRVVQEKMKSKAAPRPSGSTGIL